MSIVKAIKRFIPMNIMFRLRYRKATPRELNHLFGGEANRVFFLDAPDYGNMGDQAIAYAIKCYFAKLMPEAHFVEVLQAEYASYERYLHLEIRPTDLIVLTGGGNMGDRYPIYEATRQRIISQFPSSKIIVFPQTIEYRDDFLGRSKAKESARLYNSHSELVVCARERRSYESMKSLYPNVDIRLLPDIVLSLPVVERNEGRCGVGLCLRSDDEAFGNSLKSEILDALHKRSPDSFFELDTMSEVTRIDESNRSYLVEKKLNEFARCKLVVTDRLHAMIFAYLTKTPCIAFDNSNKKVSGVFEWIKSCSYIVMPRTVQEAVEFFDASAAGFSEKTTAVGLLEKFDDIPLPK